MMSKQSYQEYLLSPHWKSIRKVALRSAGYRCKICGSAKNLQVHHITYEHLWQETDDDLLVVCKHCHEFLHSSDLGVKRDVSSLKTSNAKVVSNSTSCIKQKKPSSTNKSRRKVQRKSKIAKSGTPIEAHSGPVIRGLCLPFGVHIVGEELDIPSIHMSLDLSYAEERVAYATWTKNHPEFAKKIVFTCKKIKPYIADFVQAFKQEKEFSSNPFIMSGDEKCQCCGSPIIKRRPGFAALGSCFGVILQVCPICKNCVVDIFEYNIDKAYDRLELHNRLVAAKKEGKKLNTVYLYFSALRPIGPGTFPKDGMIEFQNYDVRREKVACGGPAWGELIYDRKLTDKEAYSYDLVYGGEILTIC